MNLNFVILYVGDMDKVREFYIEKLGLPEVAEISSPNFVTLRAEGDCMLALQNKAAAQLPPKLEQHPGSFEVSFAVDDVDGTFKRWKERGVEMVTEPMDLPFGRYFMARDPEGRYLSAYKFNQPGS